MVAGPLANFLLAIAIFAGLFMIFGKQSTAARVESIQPESAAAAAGFQPGDLVLSINGRPIESFAEMQRIVSTSAGETLTIEVERGGTRVTLKAVPTLREMKDSFGNTHRMGVLGISRSIAPSELKMEPVGPLTAVVARRQGNLEHRSRRRCPMSAASWSAGITPISSAARS